ncbi:MAG: hypothetical protein V3R68_08860 [Gammaproteobacteria bacterium]
MIGYLGTWSAVQSYRESNGMNPVNLIADKIYDAWGDPGIKKHVEWPLQLIVGGYGGDLNHRLQH